MLIKQMDPLKDNYVSVVIPVYNDSSNLINCLEALEKQTLDKSKFEIIVVDNGSDENIVQMVGDYPNVKFFSELKEGSYAARNKGITQSSGNIIAFTDSDCVPADDWLEKGLISILDNNNVGLVAGKVRFFVRDKNNLSAVELWEMKYNYDQHFFIHEMNFGLTANLFTKKDIIERAGPFNSDLKSAGDYEWGNRVHKNGYKLVYKEELLVSHPARRSLSQLSHKIRRLIGGKTKVGLLTKRQCVKKIIIDLFPPVISTFRLVKSEDFKLLTSIDYKLKYLFVFYFVRFVTLYEMIRLLLGGKPLR